MMRDRFIMRTIGVQGLMLLLMLFIVVGSGFAEDGHKAHWGYEGEGGPIHWGDLSSEYAVCKTGNHQSPVDISETKNTPKKISYKVNYKAAPLKIVNNGHTIQVNYAPGSTISINGQSYQLLQFHFHHPSEHTVSGEEYPMEVHFVHKNDKGELAVLGVFMTEGKENPTIETLWENLPDKVNEEKSVQSVEIDASALLPELRPIFVYSGSLTTPPCSEGVSWNVVDTPIEVSQSQIDRFYVAIGKNARPVQPLNERQLQESK
ncbi:MAG: carbonic anhydrase [Candidatus Magnetominusculus sp. LBB02]|nr:carbonic anhydrase [Candidatus Magnetominusculus sp. LBB02]